MGTCFPSTLLGEEGYFVTHQNHMRKLALITGSDCVSRGLPLEKFTNLRELSWKGLLSHDDCAALKGYFDLHHERLASFEVDFIDWAEVQDRLDLFDNDTDDDYWNHDEDQDGSSLLTDLILPKREDGYKGFLPNLQTLSLRAASFRGSWDFLINAFNLHSVKKLTLLNCKFALELLNHMVRTNVCLHATQIELSLRRAEGIEQELEMVDFLAPFSSLEEVFLMFDSDYNDSFYVEMVLRHRETLRRLVYHRRSYCLAEKAPYYEEYCDDSLEEGQGDGFGKILCHTKLESAGVCGEPSKLEESFQSIALRVDSLRLLHLRFTGKAERKPKFLKEIDAYDGDMPSPEFTRAYIEAQRNGTTPPQRSPEPSEAEFRIRWEQIQGENWREDEDKELEAFANWAFGPHGFPRLQVLASGDFSYGGRFADTQKLWCRETGSSLSTRTWRTVEQSDIAENELIDANMDLLSAYPVSPLFYKYGREDKFPGIS